MITRPKAWLICNKCGEFFTGEMLNEGDVCKDCKKGKVYWQCTECGKFLKDCKCEKFKKIKTPSGDLGFRTAGWSRKKIDEIGDTFEKLDYNVIGKILAVAGISFAEDYKAIPKRDIAWTIADDFTYERIKDIIEGVS